MAYIYGLPAELVAGGTDVTVTPGLGVIVATGFAPGVAAGSAVAAGLGGIVLTGHTPSVTAGSGASVAPGVGHVALTGKLPVVSTTGSVTSLPGAGSVGLSGKVPTVTATTGSTDYAGFPGAGRLVIVGHAPAAGQTEEAPRGGAADRRKKKRKPQRILRTLAELAVLEPEIEAASEPPAPQIEAPAFGAVLRQLDAERAVRDRIQAENAAVTAQRQEEADAITAARQAADDAAREQAEREAEAAHQAAFAGARDERLRAMVESWNVLIQRKLDEDEEDVEQLVLGAW